MAARLVRAGLVAALVGAVLWAYCAASASRYLSGAQAARSSGRVIQAQELYRRAVQWYCPFNPYSRHAARDLLAMSWQAEQEGRPEEALAGYNLLRFAILSSRSLVTPYEQELTRASDRIASLSAAALHRDPAAVVQALASTAGREPGRLLSLLSVLCLAGWLAGAGLLLSSRLREDDGEPGRGAGAVSRWSLRLLFLGCLAAWCLALLAA